MLAIQSIRSSSSAALAVGQAVGGSGEPLLRGQLAAEDGYIRELIGEFEEQAVELLRVDLSREPADAFGEDGGVHFLAVVGDERVAQLVDETHGEERAGVVRAGWVGVRSAGLIERRGQLAAGSHVGEDSVAGIAEEQVVDLGGFANCAGDVKFHFSDASVPCN